MSEPEPDFVDFVRARQDRLLRSAVLICGDVHVAQDLLQDALVNLAKHWSRVGTGHPDAYVRRSLYHATIARSRRLRREVLTDEVPDVPGVRFDDSWVAGAAVRQALLGLPPRQRATIVLRYFEDLSEADTAAALGVTAGTVKSQTSAAMATLRTLMQADRLEQDEADRTPTEGMW